MKDSILRTKSKEFAKQVVFICRKLKTNHVEHVLVNQLLRSGTSVGANIHEAQYAQGSKDFISKFEISLKSVMKVITGLNCYMKLIVCLKKISIISKVVLLKFVECLFLQ